MMVKSCVLFLLLLGTVCERALPATGLAVPEMACFDRILTELLRERKITGMAVAVAKDGRLVFARGYGLANVEKNEPVQVDSLFRIASVSKPITAAAILLLLEQGRLDLDAKVLDILKSVQPLEGQSIEPQFRQITVRQLLHHTGGFDRGKSFDPMLSPRLLTEAVGTPADTTTIIRFMLGRPLDFEPGAQYAYSNFGYCLLGRVIEQITGKSYEAMVKESVLKPAGITRMQIGRTQLADLAEGEVRYYPPAGTGPVGSVFPDVKQPVSTPYGRFYIEAMDAHGGWIASAVDLVRFATYLDGSRKGGLLKPETLRLIESLPVPPVWADKPAYYGLGWMVRPEREGANWWHFGSLPGTNSMLLRSHWGLVWAVVLNSRPHGQLPFLSQLDRALWKAADEVKDWPDHDLFQPSP